MSHLLGIDVGTSATKVVLVDESGRVVDGESAGYPLATPRPGWTEQDPEDWWRAVCAATSRLLARSRRPEVAAIGLSGQMHGLVALDGADRVIRPAILWNDQRSGPQCRALTERAGGPEAVLALTNNPILTGYTLSKIAWLRDEEPAHFRRMRLFLNPKDWIRLKLTGEKVTEVSDASGTAAFDVRRRRWSTELLARLDIDPALFPPCVESAAITGRLRAEVARELGLPPATPVVGGGGDAVLQTLGCGIAGPGPLQTTIGTGGILACALDHPADNPGGRLQIFCNVAPDLWHCMGVALSAGASFAWLRKLFAAIRGGAPDDLPYDALTALAGEVPPGAEGLLFLPWLAGERCPFPDPDLRGGFLGLTLYHDQRAMVRAVMEGVVLALRSIYELARDLTPAPTEIHASGGGATSPLWRRIQAGIFDLPILTVEGAAHGAAYGAALVAGMGAGWWRSAAEAAAVAARVESRDLPDPAEVAAYRRLYDIYAGLHEALAPHLHALARFAADAQG